MGISGSLGISRRSIGFDDVRAALMKADSAVLIALTVLVVSSTVGIDRFSFVSRVFEDGRIPPLIWAKKPYLQGFSLFDLLLK